MRIAAPQAPSAAADRPGNDRHSDWGWHRAASRRRSRADHARPAAVFQGLDRAVAAYHDGCICSRANGGTAMRTAIPAITPPLPKRCRHPGMRGRAHEIAHEILRPRPDKLHRPPGMFGKYCRLPVAAICESRLRPKLPPASMGISVTSSAIDTNGIAAAARALLRCLTWPATASAAHPDSLPLHCAFQSGRAVRLTAN
jgi:hypothetical protein